MLELWSLFDFLMPGFLGTEQHFNMRYGHPIVLSRDAKSSSKEQEAGNDNYNDNYIMEDCVIYCNIFSISSGALAMEALHRQVLPFLLRRMKEDVLQDLPPKIIQDYHCDLSPLQVSHTLPHISLFYVLLFCRFCFMRISLKAELNRM